MTELTLNRERTEALYQKIGEAVREHLAAGEPSREKVFEALNALGNAAHVVLEGTGFSANVIQFFIAACYLPNVDAFTIEYEGPIPNAPSSDAKN